MEDKKAFYYIESDYGDSLITEDINEAIRYLVKLKNERNVKRTDYSTALKEKEDAKDN